MFAEQIDIEHIVKLPSIAGAEFKALKGAAPGNLPAYHAMSMPGRTSHP
jgi:hypothetical protein